MGELPMLRFPRIPKAKQVGRATRSTWRKPDFFVFVNERDSLTDFTHRLNFLIPQAIREQDQSVFTMLFKVQSVNIRKEIQHAYRQTKFKGLPVSELFHRALRKVFIAAMLEVFLKAKKSRDPYAKYLEGGRKSFRNAAAAKRTRQEEFRIKRAIHFARLYRQLYPFAEEVLRFLREQQTGGGQKLESDLKQKFHQRWITHVTSGRAFQHLPNIPGHDTRCSLQNPTCTARQLAVAIIWSLEDQSGVKPSLSPDTILEHYIPLGNKHLRIRKKLRAS